MFKKNLFINRDNITMSHVTTAHACTLLSNKKLLRTCQERERKYINPLTSRSD